MMVCKQLKKLYGSTCAVSTLDLAIPAGQVVGLLGENGAGKSTLLKMLAGLIRPTAGEVLLDGRDPRTCPDEIAYMSEEGSWFPEWHAWKHAAFYERFLPRFDRERFVTLTSFFQLPMDKRAGQMSTGEQAKLEIALGFSRGARYLLMDEPFLGKDVFARRDFLQMMAANLREEETVLVATHMVDEIEPFLDRALVFRYGRLKADATIDLLREQGTSLIELMAAVCEYDGERIRRFLNAGD